MNCRHAQRLLFDHRDGLLTGREEAALAAHLQDCDLCRRLHDAAAAIEARARELAEWQPAPRRSPRRRALEGWLAAQQAVTPDRRSAFPPAGTSFPALSLAGLSQRFRWLNVAAVAAAFLSFLMFSRWNTPRNRGRSSDTTSLRPSTGKGLHPDRLASGRQSAVPPGNSPDPRMARLYPHRPRTQGGEPPYSPTGVVPGVRRSRESARRSDPGLLHQALTVDDLVYVNRDPTIGSRQWAPLSRNEWEWVEARVRQVVRVRDDFVQIAFPRLATTSDRQIARAVEQYRHAAAIVDPRLLREVTLAFKATALADVCDHLRADTGIPLAAGPSVADEKVTLFCEKTPLREVMRQLSRPFGYAWLRSGKAGEYHYDLVQDLKSQLLEEELRNRDRNAALLALEIEIDRYRPYLSLSPDEALERSRTAAPAEKKLLEQLAGPGWGPIQMYFRLSSQELAALRAGQKLAYSAEPKPGEQPLPPDAARGVLQSLRDVRLIRFDDGFRISRGSAPESGGLLPSSSPEARATVTLELPQTELGQFALDGNAGVFTRSSLPRNSGLLTSDGPVAVGTSAAAARLENTVVNPRLARDPAMRSRVMIQPRASCRPAPDPHGTGGSRPEPKVTTADVLEAVHRATGFPIVSDYYTRLYPQGDVAVQNQPLFEALNQLAGSMHLRWNKEGDWLQFRSASYYDDRLKEVPNRLLRRWAAARQRQGVLSLDDLVEIAQLPDAQLDAKSMAEGARVCFGLVEWPLACVRHLRPHLQFLAGFTPAQRQEATSAAGLVFTKMSLPQQQQFMAHALALDQEPLQSLDELAGAVLRVDYTQPGWFQWQVPGPNWCRFVVPMERGKQGRRVLMAPVRERSREAALAAARRLDPQVGEAIRQAASRRVDAKQDAGEMAPQAGQIVPTKVDLRVIYIPGLSNRHAIHVVETDADYANTTW